MRMVSNVKSDIYCSALRSLAIGITGIIINLQKGIKSWSLLHIIAARLPMVIIDRHFININF